MLSVANEPKCSIMTISVTIKYLTLSILVHSTTELVTVMLSVVYAECRLNVPKDIQHNDAECKNKKCDTQQIDAQQKSTLTVMLSVIYAEYHLC